MYNRKVTNLIAKEIISKSLPTLGYGDTCETALNIMESFRVSHLPLVNNGEYIGLVSEKMVYDLHLNNYSFDLKDLQLTKPFVYDTQHIFEVAQTLFDIDISVIPVLDIRLNFVGAITAHDLSSTLAKSVSANAPGGVIVLEVNQNDYMLSQIANIVESNDAKILSMYISQKENDTIMEVTLKLNISNLTSVIQTFVRYNYDIKAVFMDGTMFKDVYADRYKLFMKYMEI